MSHKSSSLRLKVQLLVAALRDVLERSRAEKKGPRDGYKITTRKSIPNRWFGFGQSISFLGFIQVCEISKLPVESGICTHLLSCPYLADITWIQT